MIGLSEKQNKILEYIKSFIKNNGYPPSIREIGEAFKLKSTATVYGHLDRIEKKGFIKRQYGISRSIRVIETNGEIKD